jgi:hypothetical protein
MHRPNILMFFDLEWNASPYRKQQHRYEEWLALNHNLVVIEIGAGSSIPTVRRESIKQSNGRFIRINLKDAKIPSRQGVSIQLGAKDALEQLDALSS